jgi:hypothetical protein
MVRVRARLRGMRYLWTASAMLAAVAVITARPCIFVTRVGAAVSRAGLAARVGQGAAGTRALLCAGSIGRAWDSGMFTQAQMEYMQATRESRDARDIIFHRAMMKMCAGLRKQDACVAASIDATRKANNALIHVLEDVDDFDKAMPLNETLRKGRGRGRRRG